MYNLFAFMRLQEIIRNRCSSKFGDFAVIEVLQSEEKTQRKALIHNVK